MLDYLAANMVLLFAFYGQIVSEQRRALRKAEELFRRPRRDNGEITFFSNFYGLGALSTIGLPIYNRMKQKISNWLSLG